MTDQELWYVCKRLCNAERVDALRKVMSAPEPMTVSQIADMLRIKEPTTSQYLAQLEDDCGFIVAKRFGRYVTYSPNDNSKDSRSETLTRLFKSYFRQEATARNLLLARPQPAPPFANQLPALANQGRVRVALHLRRFGSANVSALMKLLNQCEAGIRRHLRIISACGMGELQQTTFVWREPEDPVVKTFLDLFDHDQPADTHHVNYCKS